MTLILFTSCENDSTLSMQKPMTRRVISSATTGFIEDIGQLHNEGVTSFLTYAENLQIHPFDNGVFTETLIQEYVEDFVLEYLGNHDYSNFLYYDFHVTETRLSAYKNSLSQIFENELLSTQEMELAIMQVTEEYLEESGYDDEVLSVELVAGVAMGTNRLWGGSMGF